MFALNIDLDGRILSATYEEFANPWEALVEALPDGDIRDWKYVDGQYVYDPLPAQPAEPPSDAERIRQLEEALELLLSGVTQ